MLTQTKGFFFNAPKRALMVEPPARVSREETGAFSGVFFCEPLHVAVLICKKCTGTTWLPGSGVHPKP